MSETAKMNQYEREAVNLILDTLPGLCRIIGYMLDNGSPYEGMRDVLRHQLESALQYLSEDGGGVSAKDRYVEQFVNGTGNPARPWKINHIGLSNEQAENNL